MCHGEKLAIQFFPLALLIFLSIKIEFSIREHILVKRGILNLYLFSNQKLFNIHWYTFNGHSTFIWEVPTCHCNFFQQCPYWECVDLCCNIHQDIVMCKNTILIFVIIIHLQAVRKTNKCSFNQTHVGVFYSVIGSS